MPARVPLSALLLVAGGLVAPSVRAQDTQIALHAVRAKNGTENQVRLLWIVKQGWLPAAGIDVYRSDQTTALNATTGAIVVDSHMLTPDTMMHIGRTVAASRPLFAAGLRTGEVAGTVSSGTAFTAFKGKIEALKAQPGTRADQLAPLAGKDPTVLAYRARLKAPVQTPATAPVVQTDDDKTISVRIQATLAAINSFSSAQSLGMAYVDHTAQPGVAYTYTICAHGDAAKTPIATVTVPASAPSALAPPIPQSAAGVQIGTTSIALHWEPVSAETEAALVSVSYNVYRGKDKLNEHPIRIPLLPTKNGGHVAPMNNFIDQNTPSYGDVKYTIEAVDAFGRSSERVPVTATITDLRVPGAVFGQVALPSKTNPGAVRIFWRQSDPTTGDIPATDLQTSLNTMKATSYDVYRVEPGQPDKLLTSMPIAGAAIRQDMATSLPTEFNDLTLAGLQRIDPGLGTSTLATTKASPNETIDQMYATMSQADRQSFQGYGLDVYQSFLDTTTSPDKSYTYYVLPCYSANPTHHGKKLANSDVTVPTTAVPPTPAGFTATYAAGQGSFGFVTSGATPTMRTVGVVGAAIQQSRMQQHLALSAAKATPVTGTASSGTGKSGGSSTSGTSGLLGHVNTILGNQKVTIVNKPLVAPKKINARYVIAAADLPPAPAIAGTVTLNWQASPFTSAVGYRIYRGTATGLFPTVQVTARTLPPGTIPTLNTTGKVGSPSRGAFSTVQQIRMSPFKYFEDYANLPNQDYVLVGETKGLTFTDTMPVSQRMHYHYMVIPISRWGVQGNPTAMSDVLIPATLPPSTPTLQAAQVDETVSDGHVRLTIATNPADENVTRYYVFRKPLLNILQKFKADAETKARNVQVASARGKHYVPPATLGNIPTLNPGNLTSAAMKSGGNALMKSILDPTDYVKVGEIAAPTAQTTTSMQFVDTSGVPQAAYVYMVTAINKDAIGSKASSPVDGTALKVKCDAPLNLAGALDTTGDSPVINLTWHRPPLDVAATYVVERASEHYVPASSTGGTPQQQIQQLKQTVTQVAAPLNYVTVAKDLSGLATATGNTATTVGFQDTSARYGRRYTYRLRAVDSNGLFSTPLTTQVVVPPLPPAAFNDPTPAANTPATTTTTPTTPTTGTTPTTPGTTTQPGGGVRPIKTPVGVATLGTPNAPSKSAEFSNTYLVNGSGLFAVKVEKAAYSVTGYAIDAQNFYYCKPTEKFLKLTLLVKNVSASPQSFDYQTVTAGGMGADGDDLSPTKNWKALDTNALANRTIPAGGTIEVEGVLTVSADGDPKTVTFGQDAFDLSDAANAIAPLPAQYGGSNTAAAEMPAKADGTFYSLAYTDGAVASMANEGNGFGVTLNLRNTTLANLSISNDNYTLELVDTDGDKYPAVKSTAAPISLAPGAQGSLHFTFDCPKTIMLQSLRVRERDGRIYVFPIGAR